MKIGVLGTGAVGRALAGRLAELGHTVWLGTRDVEATLAEQVQRAYPEARVVKALNTLTAALMVNPAELAKADHTVFVSGDEDEAKELVTGLLRDFGPPTSSTSAGSVPPAAPRCCCRSGCA